MKRLIQRSLAGSLILSAAVAIVAYRPGPAETARAKDVKNSFPTVQQKFYTEAIPHSKVKFDMIPVAGGTFVMGSAAKEAGRAEDEGPQHRVTLRPFWMGKTEVTWEEYDLFWRTKEGGKAPSFLVGIKTADAVTRPTRPYADQTFGHGHDGHPAICITHHAAMEYCRWLSAATGNLYRLPTEAEWEYACRAGTTTAYSFGDDPKNLGEYAWYAENSDDKTHVVGKKKPNPWGLYDMHGNVAEWCLDRYRKDYYGTFKLDSTTLAPFLLPGADRFSDVARGGSWNDDAPLLRSAARRGSNEDWIQRDPQRPQSIWWLTDAEFVGFRVVRPVEEQDNLKNVRSKVTRESR
jgi:formylglycine-generating enzyme required for sulfatase activity